VGNRSLAADLDDRVAIPAYKASSALERVPSLRFVAVDHDLVGELE
jgi:hypothetical protein